MKLLSCRDWRGIEPGARYGRQSLPASLPPDEETNQTECGTPLFDCRVVSVEDENCPAHAFSSMPSA